MQKNNAVSILIDNKKSILISTLACLLFMFLFRNSAVTIALATLVTAPNLIAILGGEERQKEILYQDFRLLRVYKYSMVSLLALAVSIIPSYIATVVSYSDIATKSFMAAVYALSYSLVAPLLYKIATATNGDKYKLKYVVCTVLVVSASELCIHSLQVLSSTIPMTSFLTAPLVCLVYILSLYLLTIVNLYNNNR